MRNLHRAINSSSFAVSGSFQKAPLPEQKPRVSEAADRQRRLAAVIAHEIIPRLMLIHHEVLKPCACEPNAPTKSELEEFALLVLGPDVDAATNYIQRMKQGGSPLNTLFSELLEPAARLLGKMWDEDRCDFLDVTLGVARLQELLAIFNDSHCVSSFGETRRVITATTAGEQHRFGMAMVEKFLRASGWHVRSEAGSPLESVAAAVEGEWFAVAGVTLSCESRLDALAKTIKTIRERSCNKTIGVMVGGPVFIERPELARRVGADASAVNASAAVILAQKLLGLSAKGRKLASAVA
jgi:MerR family transcriptional regulator, light-induced transcriptional regulator